MSIRDEILRDLREKYHFVAIPFIQAGREIGLAPQTTYDLSSRGKFPLPVIQHAQKKCVTCYALADFLAAASGYTPSPPLKNHPRHQPSAALADPRSLGVRNEAAM